ncbi:hypothetical protein FBU59_002179 [Linderina macrospora]|uniref:Uncharacterized protein n=1 Tax=Linderina macrospora TaxID=4868 RepID=A0ACC1JBR3_9FUNG|nr:hypothetical protein FBU59_002179 [Linderina macrospora]
MVSGLANKFNSNSGSFDTAAKVASILGPPELLGSSLDHLQAPSAAALMPGIAMDPALAATSGPPPFYVGYKGDDKILWFKIQPDSSGNEQVVQNGWKPLH